LVPPEPVHDADAIAEAASLAADAVVATRPVPVP
jgi:hypothetical protein